MVRALLLVAGGYYLGTGLFILAAPEVFYAKIPGVAATGPFNGHFLRDVGFAFATSAVALFWGVASGLRPLLISGAFWPFAHGVFHLTLWAEGGCAPDFVGLNDLALVILPSFLTLGLAFAHQGGAAKSLVRKAMPLRRVPDPADPV